MSVTSLVCLVGATGTGKTAAALALAGALGGGVVNFDSRQVYAGLGIVTAQPTPQEQAVCPHSLYGYLPVDRPVRAGSFAAEILARAETYRSEGLVPILVGGTGLYLKSLVDGLAPIPDVDPRIREELARECASVGSPVLYARLRGVDPDYASKIHPNDPQRICRALEVFAATGRTLTWWHGQTRRPEGLRALKIGLRTDLATLTPRLERRIGLMLEAGALDEVRLAYKGCPHRDAPGFSGIGCPELLAVLLDGLDMAQARADWLRSTRAYAKRQLTWFNKDGDIAWHDPADFEGMTARARAFLESPA
ncbi:tRNA (adenosine(37)-N6)-dimethylallyltransferase MiaA [Desulfomicrobium escambiense]|uniref:tRNA (adenosine(37)-N6)-dimethylallyltransferase MiaA n=1 Tax=Desulfomicrobium escambiense TaxID=29503 RepID=UPI0004194A30|nr:tRNA (adenosine(37)-N6)-dimethylallyltransferase MiaA [Desulfomicrobium escambiense]